MKKLASPSGNFWKDVTRVMGFMMKRRSSRKAKGEGKVMKRLKREFNK